MLGGIGRVVDAMRRRKDDIDLMPLAVPKGLTSCLCRLKSSARRYSDSPASQRESTRYAVRDTAGTAGGAAAPDPADIEDALWLPVMLGEFSSAISSRHSGLPRR